jgi:CDP-4-dehydro-6-deoxyglucose reductase, E3
MPAPSTTSFQARVEPSGRIFQVASGETLLTAAIRQGIGLPYGCKDGACGSCKCLKTAGTVVHGPHQEKALSEAEEASGYVLTCCATALSDVTIESRQVTAEGALPIKKIPTRVSKMEKRSEDVMMLHMQLPANDVFQYRAGQYVEFILRDGSRRSYSMANAPGKENLLELHIRHMPGGKFTDHVFGAMKEKDILRMEGPFGSFFLREDSDKPIILLASGTGFAPIKALLEYMQTQDIQRPAHVYWGARRPTDLYMQDWLVTHMQRSDRLQYTPVVSDACEEDTWAGRTGFVHHAVMQDYPDLRGFQVYACGAPAMVDSARRDFVALAGLAADEFFADAFTSEADKV